MDDPAGDDLVPRVLAGDEDAAREFFRRLHPFVLRIVRNHLPPRQSEEDLCQMIFQKAFTKLDQYSGRMPVAHWMSRIAVNTCINELKKEKGRRELREGDLGEEERTLIAQIADPATDHQTAQRSAQEIVPKLLSTLDPADRLILSLLYIEGHSVAETSALTGFSKATVKIRAFRARHKLNKIVPSLLKNELP